MTDREFYNEEFEDFLRRKTDQYKMYPSDRAWREIFNALHTRRRRFVAGMSILISGILIIAAKELLLPAAHIPGKKAAESLVSSPKPATDVASIDLPVLAKPGLSKSSLIYSKTDEPSVSQLLDFYALTEEVPGGTIDRAPAASGNEVFNESGNQVADISSSQIIQQPFRNPVIAIHAELAASSLLRNPTILIMNDPGPLLVAPTHRFNEKDRQQKEWLQDYATQHLSPMKQHNYSWQFYFSPTVNYRKLSGAIYADSRSTVQNVPIALVHFGNANDFVDHTPAIGYELGGAMLYKLTRNLSLKAGLQFNYSRYVVKAYSSGPELATIALNSNFGYSPDSLTGYTNVRNFSGKSKEELQNRYFQLSIPLGVEMRLLGNGKLQIHIGASIQPTYLLNRNSYVLTTDYTNYTKEPSIFRKWNLNGGLEAFISYEVGRLRWQIGPQFRYQFFSTYADQYPLKENLMEYGIKIGVSKIIH
ncbi:MAG: outer membrane beta-barrel protein [Chitinophagales bacterium]